MQSKIIRLITDHLSPAAIAAIIADLLKQRHPEVMVIRSLVDHLEATVGAVESIEFMDAAGITAEQLDDVLFSERNR